MTIVVAWERFTRAGGELCIISDGRLSNGSHIDYCQKIFRFSRDDCAIAFSGITALAYPFILQVLSVVENDPKLKDRSIDFKNIPKVLLSYLNKFVREHIAHDLDDFTNDLSNASFILGGWSAALAQFLIYRIRYCVGTKKYIIIRKNKFSKRLSSRFTSGAKIVFSGNYVPAFIDALVDKIERSERKENLDYEPLEILRSMLQNEIYVSRTDKHPLNWVKSGAIGGEIQLLKVYRFCRSTHLQVPSISNADKWVFQGRRLTDGEVVKAPKLGAVNELGIWE